MRDSRKRGFKGLIPSKSYILYRPPTPVYISSAMAILIAVMSVLYIPTGSAEASSIDKKIEQALYLFQKFSGSHAAYWYIDDSRWTATRDKINSQIEEFEKTIKALDKAAEKDQKGPAAGISKAIAKLISAQMKIFSGTLKLHKIKREHHDLYSKAEKIIWLANNAKIIESYKNSLDPQLYIKEKEAAEKIKMLLEEKKKTIEKQIQTIDNYIKQLSQQRKDKIEKAQNLNVEIGKLSSKALSASAKEALTIQKKIIDLENARQRITEAIEKLTAGPYELPKPLTIGIESSRTLTVIGGITQLEQEKAILHTKLDAIKAQIAIQDRFIDYLETQKDLIYKQQTTSNERTDELKKDIKANIDIFTEMIKVRADITKAAELDIDSALKDTDLASSYLNNYLQNVSVSQANNTLLEEIKGFNSLRSAILSARVDTLLLKAELISTNSSDFKILSKLLDTISGLIDLPDSLTHIRKLCEGIDFDKEAADITNKLIKTADEMVKQADIKDRPTAEAERIAAIYALSVIFTENKARLTPILKQSIGSLDKEAIKDNTLKATITIIERNLAN